MADSRLIVVFVLGLIWVVLRWIVMVFCELVLDVIGLSLPGFCGWVSIFSGSGWLGGWG